MPVWLQVWIVVATVGLVTIALFAVSTLRRFLDKLAKDLSQVTQTLRQSASRIDRVADEAGSLLTDVRETVSPVQNVIRRFEALGHRTADLSASLLDQVEPPLHTATALVRGVRTSTGSFMHRLMNRVNHRQAMNNGGVNHER